MACGAFHLQPVSGEQISNSFAEHDEFLAPDDTAYTRWSCHSGLANPVQIVSTPPTPAMGARLLFLASRPCRPAGWMAMLLIKAGNVETNPGPTTTHKQVWICDICHRQIQVRKQISIRCNRNEHWVHLRCAGNRLAQYTDTWTCHQHRESRLTTHTDITPPNVFPYNGNRTISYKADIKTTTQ